MSGTPTFLSLPDRSQERVCSAFDRPVSENAAESGTWIPSAGQPESAPDQPVDRFISGL